MKVKKVNRSEVRELLFEGVRAEALSIAQALKMTRQIVSKNQAEYAKLVKVSKKIIADIESGKGNPTLSTLNRLFTPVGIEVSLRIISKDHQ